MTIFHQARDRRRAAREKASMVNSVLDFPEKEKFANDNGLERPPEFDPKDRMQCAPTWHSVLDAVDNGIALAEAMGETHNRSTAETATDAGFFGIVYGFTQFVRDSLSIQECMDRQDEQHSERMQQYVRNVETFKRERAAPIPQFASNHAQRTQEQRFADYRQCNDKRAQQSLSSLTWWEYESMMKQNLNPVEPASSANVENSVLCPNGNKNNSHGYGAHAYSHNGGSSGGSDGTGASNSSGLVGGTFCFKDDNGDFTQCYRP